jgi:hypothetical protein
VRLIALGDLFLLPTYISCWKTDIAIPTRVSELLTNKVRRNGTFLANKQNKNRRSAPAGDVGLTSKGLASLAKHARASVLNIG